MITHIGRIMTGRTETRKTCHPKRVVESHHARDIYRYGIEYFLATRHRSAILVPLAGPANVAPGLIRIEDKWRERFAGGVSERRWSSSRNRIVDANEKLGEQIRQCIGAARCAGSAQMARIVVTILGGKETG